MHRHHRHQRFDIKRLYKQGGKVIHNSHVEIKGMSTEYNSITDSYCKAEDKAFNAGAAFPSENRGGMTQMGKALARGMVLVLSIWDDSGAHMQWLDGATGNVTVPGNLRGPCSPTGSDPVAIQAQYPNAFVTWSNIKVGDIGTIYQRRANLEGVDVYIHGTACNTMSIWYVGYLSV